MLSELIAWANAHLSPGWTLVVLLLGISYGVNLKNLNAYRTDLDGLEVARREARRDPTRKYSDFYRRLLRRVLAWLRLRLGAHPWSPTAFDWCLRLAVIYPILSVLIFWALGGVNTTGIPALLPDDAHGAARGGPVVGLAIFGIASIQFDRSTGWRRRLWAAGAGAGAYVYAAILDWSRLTSVVRFAWAWLILAAVVAVGAFGVGRVVAWGGEAQPISPSFLVFLGALPVINALFDWGSLGLTRFLLRRNLARRGPWPALGYGGLDAVAALGILALLAVAVTAGLTGLNALAAAGGLEEPMIEVPDVLDRLHDTPGDPAVWWIYVMLFSTLLPSVAHIAIAVVALVRTGWPEKWNAWYERNLDPKPLAFGPRRYWMAAFLTLRQITEFGLPLLALGVVATVLWNYWRALPWLADGLLALATWVATVLQ